MKRRVLVKAAAGMVMLMGLATGAYAWSGNTWGTESRSTIESIANSMINYRWTPKNTMSNGWGLTFSKGTYYIGEAYTQNNPQENLSEFANLVSITAGGTSVGIGNDCSGFVSISWKLPSRYTTTTFESDATSTGGYVNSLGDKRTAQTVLLLKGDALNASGNHIVLVREKIPSGLKTMEQTPPKAISGRDWTWSQLLSYRPIRRNSMDETLFYGYLSKGQTGYHGNPTSVSSSSSNYYYSNTGLHSGRLAGPVSTDYDLYLWKWNYGWQVVASAGANECSYTSSKSIDYNGSAGYYLWGVYSYSGSGNYVLSVKKP